MKNKSLKDEIDLTSKYAVSLRNRTGMSWLFIQQANRDQGNIERFKANKSAFTLNDTKDSGNIVQDCEIVLAVYNPNRDGLAHYNKYNVNQLNNCFRSIMCLKNRYDESEIEIAVGFYGKANIWCELPDHDAIYDYDTYTNPMFLLSKDSTDRSEQSIDNPNNNSNLNFTL